MSSEDTSAPVLDGELLVPDTKDESGLTLRERTFLDVLFDVCGGDIRAAMDEAGYHHSVSTNSVSKALGRQIRERSKEYLISQTARAAITLSGVLSDPTRPGNDSVIKAAKEILDRGGVFKEEAVQVTEIRNMYILPPKEIEALDD